MVFVPRKDGLPPARHPVELDGGSPVDRFIIKHGWSDGDVKILRVLKETAARFQAVEYDNYRRAWERRPQHISKEAVIAEFCSEAEALAAVKHAKSVWASHEKRVNDTKSAHMQAVAQRRTTWISALKGENHPTDHQSPGASRAEGEQANTNPPTQGEG